MTCREFTSFISDYLDGELSPDVRARFVRHLERCDNCVQYLADYERTLALEHRVFDDEDTLPAQVPESLVAAILASRKSSG